MNITDLVADVIKDTAFLSYQMRSYCLPAVLKLDLHDRIDIIKKLKTSRDESISAYRTGYETLMNIIMASDDNDPEDTAEDTVLASLKDVKDTSTDTKKDDDTPKKEPKNIDEPVDSNGEEPPSEGSDTGGGENTPSDDANPKADEEEKDEAEDTDPKDSTSTSVASIAERLVTYKRKITSASHVLDRQFALQLDSLDKLIEKDDSVKARLKNMRLPALNEFKIAFENIDDILEALNAHHIEKFVDTGAGEGLSLSQLFDSLFSDAIKKKLAALGIEKTDSGRPAFTSLKDIEFNSSTDNATGYVEHFELLKKMTSYMSIVKPSQYVDKINDVLTAIKAKPDHKDAVLAVVDMLLSCFQQLMVVMFALKHYFISTLSDVYKTLTAVSKKLDTDEADIPTE